MKTPCLALNLVAVTLMAATGPVHADALHSGPELAGSMVGYVKPLSSHLIVSLRLTGGTTFSRPRAELRAGATGVAPMLGAAPYGVDKGLSRASVPQTALDQELVQLRDGIGRVRLMPQVSLGMSPHF
jgi:hypothetical protein